MSGKLAERNAAIAKIRQAAKALTPPQLTEAKRAEAEKALTPPVNTKPRKGDRHKPAYMADYMRKRRAK